MIGTFTLVILKPLGKAEKGVTMRLKNSVKLMVGVVLAMVMVFSMSMSVFAAPSGTVDVTIINKGSTVAEQTVSISAIQAEVGTDGHYYTTTPYTDYDTEGVKVPTVADALIKAYAMENSLNALTLATYTPGGSSTSYAISYDWDLHPYVGNPGIYFLYFDWVTTANESFVDNGDGTTTYTGDTWILDVDGNESSLYASNIDLSTVSEVVFEYKQVSYTYPNS